MLSSSINFINNDSCPSIRRLSLPRPHLVSGGRWKHLAKSISCGYNNFLKMFAWVVSDNELTDTGFNKNIPFLVDFFRSLEGMGAQEPYNESQLNSIIISGKIVTEEAKFYQSLQDPIVLVFERLVSFWNKLFILIFLPNLTIRPRVFVLQL